MRFKSEFTWDWQFQVKKPGKLEQSFKLAIAELQTTPNVLNTIILLYLTILWMRNLERAWLGDLSVAPIEIVGGI